MTTIDVFRAWLADLGLSAEGVDELATEFEEYNARLAAEANAAHPRCETHGDSTLNGPCIACDGGVF